MADAEPAVYVSQLAGYLTIDEQATVASITPANKYQGIQRERWRRVPASTLMAAPHLHFSASGAARWHE